MKLKKDLILRQVADQWIVVPVGKTTREFGGILNLNETGVMLWQGIEEGLDVQPLAEKLTQQYDVTLEQALADVAAFYEKLRLMGCTEE